MNRALTVVLASITVVTVTCGSSACGSSAKVTQSASTTKPPTSSTSTTPSTAAPPDTTPPESTAVASNRTTTTVTRGPTSTTRPALTGTVALAEKNNGTTVTVARGATVVVVLSSTYWGFPTPPNASVLAPVGPVVTAPAPINSCVPGQGCGTVTATYRAVGVGTARISASRTTCGEALLCSGGAGSYSVEIEVTAG